jgi:hypothetical protein
MLEEYIITLKNKDDLEEFYKDMEILRPTPYNCMPERAVPCERRRSISRNTHYLLTSDEAEVLRNDPRIEAVMLVKVELAAIKPLYTQTGNFDKSATDRATDVNWGLLRCIEGAQRTNWGSNGTANQNASIQFNASGKHVDVVIIDGHIDPAHPEYAVNPDGSGGSRVVQLNWFLLNSTADLLDNDNASLLSSDYVYTPYIGSTDLTGDNNHGAHVAGTAAGNTQGWARSANIYNINPYGTNPNSLASLIMWDYIRAFHLNKSVNPVTGRKNPTICNGSYGSSFIHPFDYGSFTTGPINRVTYRGTTVGDGVTALTNQQLLDNGIYAVDGEAEIPFYSASVAADIEDAIADGIIVVAAAGNEYQKIDVVGGTDYNNTYRALIDGTNFTLAYHRGTTPGAVPGVICVGAVGSTVNETKAVFSNCGPRIDVYAPGQNINSSKHSGGVTDPRNTSYRLDKINGTSMASPQVCGILACALEIYPNMTPAQAMQYIKIYGKTGQMTDTGGTANDTTSLQGSDNRYLFAKKERPDSGNVFPKQDYFLRPTGGTVYPRTRIKRYL